MSRISLLLHFIAKCWTAGSGFLENAKYLSNVRLQISAEGNANFNDRNSNLKSSACPSYIQNACTVKHSLSKHLHLLE